MEFVRTVDFSAYSRKGYEVQYLYSGESCTLLGSSVPAGGAAPPMHVHAHCDQIYFVLEGELMMSFGGERQAIPQFSMVYIPAGTPHHNWNEGSADEFHFEILAPSPLPTQPIMTPVERAEKGSNQTPYVVRAVDESEPYEARPGFWIHRLLQDADGSENVAMYLGEVRSGGGGPGMHIHPFDQFYYVIEGELTIEVAMQKHTLSPHSLAVLPAGVPHRQWNEGDVSERHLALIVPPPAQGVKWDQEVVLESR